MATAIRTAHWDKGFWNYNGGYEYNLVLCAALAELAESGPGDFSLDHVLGLEKRGAGWGLAAVALGVTGSLITVARGRAVASRTKHANVTPGSDPTSADPQSPSGTSG